MFDRVRVSTLDGLGREVDTFHDGSIAEVVASLPSLAGVTSIRYVH
jgi:hypothetical protein